MVIILNKDIQSIIQEFNNNNAAWDSIKKKIVRILGEIKEPVEIRKERTEEFKEILGYSYEIIGVGAFRATFNIHGYAVKIAIRNNGIEDLYKEKCFWDNLPITYRRYFSECYYVEEGFGIFELTPLMPAESQPKYEELMKIILNELSRDIIVKDNWHHHRKNWGLRCEIPVIIDYADCEFKIP